jgi:hypothetical protein
VKDWEIIADNLSKTGWSWGCVSAIDSNGRTIWIVDAHREGQRFIVHADEKLTAFLELESQLIWTRPNVGQTPYIFLLTGCWNFRQAHTRAKSVRRLPHELHLTLFPQGYPSAKGSFT